MFVWWLLEPSVVVQSQHLGGRGSRISSSRASQSYTVRPCLTHPKEPKWSLGPYSQNYMQNIESSHSINFPMEIQHNFISPKAFWSSKNVQIPWPSLPSLGKASTCFHDSISSQREQPATSNTHNCTEFSLSSVYPSGFLWLEIPSQRLKCPVSMQDPSHLSWP
jgi:hypothetical protein